MPQWSKLLWLTTRNLCKLFSFFLPPFLHVDHSRGWQNLYLNLWKNKGGPLFSRLPAEKAPRAQLFRRFGKGRIHSADKHAAPFRSGRGALSSCIGAPHEREQSNYPVKLSVRICFISVNCPSPRQRVSLYRVRRDTPVKQVPCVMKKLLSFTIK